MIAHILIHLSLCALNFIFPARGPNFAKVTHTK